MLEGLGTELGILNTVIIGISSFLGTLVWSRIKELREQHRKMWEVYVHQKMKEQSDVRAGTSKRKQ